MALLGAFQSDTYIINCSLLILFLFFFLFFDIEMRAKISRIFSVMQCASQTISIKKIRVTYPIYKEHRMIFKAGGKKMIFFCQEQNRAPGQGFSFILNFVR